VDVALGVAEQHTLRTRVHRADVEVQSIDVTPRSSVRGLQDIGPAPIDLVLPQIVRGIVALSGGKCVCSCRAKTF
jgi:hypothetical protein